MVSTESRSLLPKKKGRAAHGTQRSKTHPKYNERHRNSKVVAPILMHQNSRNLTLSLSISISISITFSTTSILSKTESLLSFLYTLARPSHPPSHHPHRLPHSTTEISLSSESTFPPPSPPCWISPGLNLHNSQSPLLIQY